MLIINQDRDKQIELHRKEQLKIGVSCYDKTILGYNLFCDNELLGTYDTMLELLKEVKNILRYKYKYYLISGFSNYEEVD